jgi:hypothetical protein
LLDRGWWRGFNKRNKQLVKACVTRKFARNRAEHCTYNAFLKMYKSRFAMFVDSGNASYLPETRHVDKQGNVVEDEIEAYGHPVEIEQTQQR